MSLQKIFENDYGQPIELIFVDVDTNTAQDISGYTTLQMLFIKPDGTTSTKTATFKTDGTDGVVAYTVENGFLTPDGQWKVRGRVSSGAAVLTTEWHVFYIES